MPRPTNCPHCASTDISRSHRRSMERILLFLKTYRCNSCHRRFHRFLFLKLPSRVL